MLVPLIMPITFMGLRLIKGAKIQAKSSNPKPVFKQPFDYHGYLILPMFVLP
jgi:hypothetical protein